MRNRLAICSILFVVAVGLPGWLALWIYLPESGRSSEEIATALLEYHDLTATNGHGSLGTELPDSLMFYHNWNPSSAAGPDFAESGYDYHRLGIYFERRFDLKRDLPGGNTWTLITTVRASPRFLKNDIWWTQHLITISNSPSGVVSCSAESNAIPADVVMSTNLPGVWYATAFAADNGWNEKMVITTNGDFSGSHYFVDNKQQKEWGRIEIENGFLIMTVTTVTNQLSGIRLTLPYTVRWRIVYADDRRILISNDSFLGSELMEKQKK